MIVSFVLWLGDTPTHSDSDWLRCAPCGTVELEKGHPEQKRPRQRPIPHLIGLTIHEAHIEGQEVELPLADYADSFEGEVPFVLVIELKDATVVLARADCYRVDRDIACLE